MGINELCNESRFQDSKGEGPTYTFSARVGEEDSWAFGGLGVEQLFIDWNMGLPVGDLRQGSFKRGRSSGLQSCLGSSSSRMQVMDAGIWAAQAVGHSSGPGSYQAWATKVRSTGMGARAATGLAGSKDLRRRRHGFAESIQFSVSGYRPLASGDRERRGRLSKPEFQKQQVLPA